MTPALAWPLAVMFTLGWVLAALFGIGHALRWIRSSKPARKPPGPAAPQRALRAASPGPHPNRDEADLLDGIRRARMTASPMAVDNSRIIADGLRLRFPNLPDTTLGLALLDVSGYVNAALLSGVPWGLQAISDSFALAAEELTRLARTEAPR